MPAQSHPTARRLLTCGVAAASITGVLAASGAAPALAATSHPATAHTASAAAAPVITGPAARVTVLGTRVTLTGTAGAYDHVEIYYHQRGVPGYTNPDSTTANNMGGFSLSFTADNDYRIYTATTGKSNNILVQIAPGVVGPLARVVKKGADYTITGTYLPGEDVTLHFHKQGTPAKDYSIARTVHTNSKGAWSKTYRADTDYRFIVQGDANDTLNGDYLIQAR